MGFRGGGQIDPPQRILVFKYPSGDRVNMRNVDCSIVVFHVRITHIQHFMDPLYTLLIKLKTDT